MKGKIAFIAGAAVGYVLGTRAGRERYEQIKRGAQQVWATEPVQRGVDFVKESIDERTDGLRAFIGRVGADVFSSFATPRPRPTGTASTTAGAGTSAPEEAAPAGDQADDAAAAAPTATSSSRASAPSSRPANKPAAKRTTSKRPPKGGS